MSSCLRVRAEAKQTTRVRAGVLSIEQRTPPDAIQLWDVGDNATDYGVHKWTERSVESVFARYDARGNPLMIDVEHLGATGPDDDDDDPKPTGGYARLELRDGAPWLTFEWSAYAVEQIATGQRRFLSPEYDVDRVTGEITALYRVSLVADPGTHRARVLAAAMKGPTMDLSMILAALRAALAAEDPAVARDSIANLVTELAKGLGGDDNNTADPPDGDQGPPSDGDATAQAAADPPGGQDASGGDTSGSDGTPSGDGDTQQARRAAAASPTPTPAVASKARATIAAPPGADIVQAAASAAVRQIEDAQRDHLLQTEGARLEPSIRRWASAQTLAVVRGLLDATPGHAAPPKRVAATRGEAHGGDGAGDGLEGDALDSLRTGMGIVKATAGAPFTNAQRELVLPLAKPSAMRAQLAAAAAGKAGK